MTGHTGKAGDAAPRRMHLNESPFPVPEPVRQAIAEAASQVNRYPSDFGPALVTEIADYAGAPESRVFVSAGTNEILHLLPVIGDVLRPDDEIVVPDPSFPTYQKVARHVGFTVVTVPVLANGVPDIDGILAAIGPKTKMVCVPSPNNPTGGLLSAAELEKLIAGVPAHILLHLDEAYYEFGREAGGPETLPLLEKRPGNWLTTRSFSKAFGLAGLRLGYGIASDEALAEHCRLRRPNFSVNAAAQAAGIAALQHRETMETNVAAIARERDRLAEGLRALGLTPFDTAANFIAIPSPETVPDMRTALAERGILVTGFAMADGTPAFRITIGLEDDNDAVLAAITDILKR